MLSSLALTLMVNVMSSLYLSNSTGGSSEVGSVGIDSNKLFTLGIVEKVCLSGRESPFRCTDSSKDELNLFAREGSVRDVADGFCSPYKL